VSSDPSENLVGIGVGSKRVFGRRRPSTIAIQFFVAHKLAPGLIEPRHLLPATWNGHPTDVVEVGRFVASAGPRDRWRPALGGCSIGAIKGIHSTYGTFGALVRPVGQLSPHLLLSCNHVLSNWEQFPSDTPILQPAPLDAGSNPADLIATLREVVPLAAAKRGRADAAVAVIPDPATAQPGFLPGVPPLVDSTPAVAFEGQTVSKIGRSTGFRSGRVFSPGVDLTVDSGEPSVGQVVLEDQILIQDAGSPFSDTGDSGALVLASKEGRALGLLCARSAGYSIANRITNVLAALAIELIV
jgi:hypothetical protein